MRLDELEHHRQPDAGALDGGASGGTGAGGGLFDSLFGKLFGGGIGGLFGNLFGGGGDQDFSGGVLGAGAAAAGGGGLFSGIGSLFSGLFSFLGFERGGIVPSAAGGWMVPQLGPGGTLAQLHANEMVLPANLSNFVQNAAASAAGGAGPGTVNRNVSAVDAQSVAKFFNANGALLAAALNRAWRNGAPAVIPS